MTSSVAFFRRIKNGQGGDHVFLAPYPNDCLADYWFDKGLRGITNPLKELSSINRMPLWEITRDTIKNIIAHYYNKNEICENEYAYFSKDFRYNYKSDEFFLQSKINKFYPAKKDHIKGIFHGILFADRNLRIPDCTITHPLLSQPVVEMGLRIPTYQSFKNGFDRIFLEIQ